MSHARATSPREQVARLKRLLRRGLEYWKGALLVLVLTGAAAYGVLTQVKREYRSECTIFAKARMRTDDRDDSTTSPEAIARQAARLKDMLTTRARLESAIKKFHLYPETTANKTMLDAVEQMKPHVGFRALEGGQYVISFDGDAPDQVKDVTQYLSESLIDEYAAGDLGDLQHEADFLAEEEQRSVTGLEDATKALTIFLADHPEFAVEAKQAATTPFGPSPTAGIPLMPKADKVAGPVTTDGELGALYRERARLEGEVHGAAGASHGIPAATASSRQLDDQIAQAQAEVEAAAKRVAETQGDLASKSNLTEDHPDMRAARMAASAAARRFHEAKVQLAALQQMKASGAASSSDSSQPAIPEEIADKLHQVDAQIVARRAQLQKASPGASAEAHPGGPPQSPVVTAVVELETEWQRLLRNLGDAKSHHDDLKLRAERTKLAFEAARSQANERMAIIDPPYRPTHPSKSQRAKVAIGGALLAWILALAYMTARMALDDTLVDADDVEALGVIPVLGQVPRLEQAVPKRSERKATVDAAA